MTRVDRVTRVILLERGRRGKIHPVLYGYLFSAIVGVALLGVALLGGHHDGDGGDAGDGGDGDGDQADAQGHHGGAQHPHFLSGLLSVQLWTCLLTFGGVTGLALRLVAHIGEPLCGALSAGVGLLAAVLVRGLWRRAALPTSSGTVSTAELVGQSATVILPFGKGQTGKIQLCAKGSTVDLLAMLSEGEDEALAAGEEVVILRLSDGTAQVVRPSALLPAASPPGSRQSTLARRLRDP